jgi:urease accessory protein
MTRATVSSRLSEPPVSSITQVLRLMQFGDSMLPVGAFSFSNGLESAIAQGVVGDVSSLRAFLLTALYQAAGSDGIALLTAHRAAMAGDMARVIQADHAVFVRKLNEEMRTMTTRMGKKLAEMAGHVLHAPLSGRWLERIVAKDAPGTFPVALALTFADSGISEHEAFAVHQYGVATMMLGAALRLMKLNYLDGQAILHEVNGTAEAAYARVAAADLDDMATFAPMTDILAAIHVKSHVRMFMN